MAQPFWDKRGNLHPTYAAARVADAAFDATEEAKKHTKLLENQNSALAEQARAQAKAQKRQNELAEEALELEEERAAEEAEHRGRLERIESDRLQSEKEQARFQRDVMVLESATDEERFEFFVDLEREDLPSFWNSLSLSHLLHKFKRDPELERKYRQLFEEMKEKASSVADVLNEHRSLKNRTDAGTRILGIFSLLVYLGVACFVTNCSVNKALLGEKVENVYGKPEYAEAWGTGYFVVILVLVVGILWHLLKNSVSVRNLFRFDKSQRELATFNETHGDTLKIQMDFEKFAQENVEERKNLLIGVLTEVHLEHTTEQKQAIADAVRVILKDRTKDYPRRCRPSDEYLSDAERLFTFFREGWPKSDLLTLECGIAHEYSTSAAAMKRLSEIPGYSTGLQNESAVKFVRIGYVPKAAENFLKDAGYAVASGSE